MNTKTGKPTPGPWSVIDRGRMMTPEIKAGTLGVARITDRNREENEANARLIAAAPELLAVLRILVQQEWHPHLSTLDAARAAIAAAEGSGQ